MKETLLLLSLLSRTLISQRHPCDRVQLTPAQTVRCSKDYELVYQAATGVRKALLQCESMRRHHRWNCTLPEDESSFVTLKQIKYATKELAFLYSITAAGALLNVAKSCSDTAMSNACGCDRQPRHVNTSGYIWMGCGDSVAFAFKFVRKIDSIPTLPRGKKARYRTMSFLHNHEVGRRLAVEMSPVRCQCVGTTASCAVKTCVRHISPLDHLAFQLASRMDSATYMDFDRNGLSPSADQLVYLDRSPDFCEYNPDFGAMGTRRRNCSVDESRSAQTCLDLCCGRNFSRTVSTEMQKCDCKFVWCCSVRCEVCPTVVTRYHCF